MAVRPQTEGGGGGGGVTVRQQRSIRRLIEAASTSR
jgi:hypothetical protein